jgi:hypothetical protein
MAFIYHAYDHYFVPMGFEMTPKNPPDAYKKIEDIEQDQWDDWIFIGEPAKLYSPFHIK